jgi:hypothetical protein
MILMHVTEYHREIANRKYRESDQKVRSMFYFMKEDNKGYPTQDRKTGWVIVDDTLRRFTWKKNKAEALKFMEDILHEKA